MSESLNECFVCSEFVQNLTRIIQGFDSLGIRWSHELSRCHSLIHEVIKAAEHLLILRQLFQDLLACLGETAIAPIHGVEFMYSFVPPRKQRKLLQRPGTPAVKTSK